MNEYMCYITLSRELSMFSLCQVFDDHAGQVKKAYSEILDNYDVYVVVHLHPIVASDMHALMKSLIRNQSEIRFLFTHDKWFILA